MGWFMKNLITLNLSEIKSMHLVKIGNLEIFFNRNAFPLIKKFQWFPLKKWKQKISCLILILAYLNNKENVVFTHFFQFLLAKCIKILYSHSIPNNFQLFLQEWDTVSIHQS